MSAGALINRVTFAGGQAGRGMRGRSDTARYQISVEVLENYCIMVEGGATRAPGTQFVLKLKDEARFGRLIPYRYSDSDYFMLVINGVASRFVRQGGVLQNDDTTPYELSVPFAVAGSSDQNIADEGVLLKGLRTANSGNTIYAAWNGKPQEITRVDTRDWICTDYVAEGGPVDTQNLTETSLIKASAITVGTTVTLTATGTGNAPFVAGQIGGVFRFDEADLSLVPVWTANETGLSGGVLRRYKGNVYSVASGTDAGVNPPEHTEGAVSSGAGKVTWTFLHPGYGFARITAVASGTVATATILSRLPDSVSASPGTYASGNGTFRWSPPAWSAAAGYPSNVIFNSPNLMWMGGDKFWLTADNDDHDLTLTDLDDGAIAQRLRSPDASLVKINWAVPSGAIILGTTDLEFSIRGPNVFDGLTPGNIRAIPESTEGSADVPPARVDGGVIWAGKSGKRLHFGRYDRQQQILDPEEISVWARSLFGSKVAKMAWQRDPHRILWIILENGSLLSFTFMPKQQIAAFSRHPRTNAFFEDVEVLPSTATGVDEVYFIVRRTIDGATARYVEQLGPFFEPQDEGAPTAEGAWFLDCALRSVGEPIKVITSLEHLEGQEVGVFADGRMQKPKTVVNGTITLDRKSRDRLVGIPLRARIKDLPRNLSSDKGPTDGDVKSVHEALLILEATGGGTVSVNGGPPEPVFETGDAAPGQPIALFSGATRRFVEGDFGEDVALELVNDDAMPCTVLAMSPRIEIEEDD